MFNNRMSHVRWRTHWPDRLRGETSNSRRVQLPVGLPTMPARQRTGTKPVGPIVRSAENAKPVFVSPGHMVDVPSLVGLMWSSLSGRHHPTPTREAHLAANRLRREFRGRSFAIRVKMSVATGLFTLKRETRKPKLQVPPRGRFDGYHPSNGC
jgi:hypothetical protein